MAEKQENVKIEESIKEKKRGRPVGSKKIKEPSNDEEIKIQNTLINEKVQAQDQPNNIDMLEIKVENIEENTF